MEPEILAAVARSDVRVGRGPNTPCWAAPTPLGGDGLPGIKSVRIPSDTVYRTTSKLN